MNKKLNSTFCTLAVTAMVSVAMLSGCSGTTAAPGASDTDQASTTAVAGGDKSMGEASMEAENTDAGIESKDTDGQKLKVMASFYPMYDFAVKIGGDKEEIDMRLKEYFADHDVMLRYDFQEVCCMTRTTANRHLRRLLEEGKLKNIGKRMQPIYVASAGYYGVSRDVLRR